MSVNSSGDFFYLQSNYGFPFLLKKNVIEVKKTEGGGYGPTGKISYFVHRPSIAILCLS